MKSKHVTFFAIIIGIGFYFYTKTYWIPIEYEKTDQNQYKYNSNGFSFETQERLTNCKTKWDWNSDKMGWLSTENYDLFFNFVNEGVKGIESMEEINLNSVNRDSLGIPIIHETQRKWMEENVFFMDTIGNCFRRIYYNKETPTEYTCYLRRLEKFKTGIISIEIKENSILKKEDYIKILKTFRIEE